MEDKVVKRCPLKGVGIFFMMLLAIALPGKEFNVIKNPKPTHIEKNFVKLKKVKEISPDINDKYFMAKPISLAVARDGSFFVFDYLVRKIFKFTKDGQFVKTFGKTGRGPGEFGNKPDQNWLYCGSDGFICISSKMNRKIIRYDTNGEFIDEIAIPDVEYSMGSFKPVSLSNDLYFLLECREHRIDVFKRMGNQLKRTYSLLNGIDRDWSILLDVKDQDLLSWRTGQMIDVQYDFSNEDLLVVYLAKTSTVCIYQKEKLLKKYNLWPSEALDNYRIRINRRKDRLKENDIFIVYMFHTFFIDKDDPSFFFIKGPKFSEEMGHRTYRFSIEGDLDKILVTDSPVAFYAKKNGFYYGIYKGSVLMYSEENEK